MGVTERLSALFGIGGRKSAEVSLASPEIRAFLRGQFEGLEGGMSANRAWNTVWVHTAVSKVVDSALSLPVVAYTGEGKRRRRLERTHPFMQVFLDPMPGPISHESFRRKLLTNALLRGSCFGEVRFYALPKPRFPFTPGGPRPRPANVYLHTADRVEVVPDANEFVREYKFRLPSGQSGTWERDRVIWFLRPSPFDDYKPSTALDALRSVVSLDGTARTAAAKAFANGGTTKGLLAPAVDMPLTDDQLDELISQITEQTGGADKAAATLITNLPMRYTAMNLSVADMQLLDAQKFSRDQVGTAFGVPLPLMGDSSASTYENYRSSRASLAQDTAGPLVRWELGIWQSEFVDRFWPDEDITLEIEWDEVEALLPPFQEREQAKNNAIVYGRVTLNEARAEDGRDAYTDPKADQPLVPTNVQSLEKATTKPEPRPVTPPAANAPSAPAEGGQREPRGGSGDADEGEGAGQRTDEERAARVRAVEKALVDALPKRTADVDEIELVTAAADLGSAVVKDLVAAVREAKRRQYSVKQLREGVAAEHYAGLRAVFDRAALPTTER